MRLLALSLISVILISCGEEPDPKAEQLQFAIEVLNPKSDQVIIHHQRDYHERTLREPAQSDTLTLDSINRAFWNVDGKESFFVVQVNESLTPIFLKPGKALNMQIDSENPSESVVFTGSLAKGNTMHYEVSNAISKVDKSKSTLLALPEAEFLTALDSIRGSIDYLLMDFVGNKPSFSDFFIQEQSFTNYYFLAGLTAQYFLQHDYYRQEGDTAKISDNFREELAKINSEEPEALANPYYQGFLSYYLYAINQDSTESASQELRDQPWYYQSQYMSSINGQFKTDAVRSHLFFKQLNEMVMFYAPHLNDSLFSMGMNNIHDTVLVAHLNSELANWDKLAKGTLAPGFTYPDTDSNMVSLSDFRGKWVYVDVWATWCGPCKRQIPFLKNMERKLNHDQVAIVSVSVDRNKAAWEKMVKDDHLKGVQLHAGGWEGITDDYNIKGIPRFMLIDPEGRIYDPNFTDPSNGALEEIEAIISPS